jgi:nucleotide-binding universal stress UspA family protein
MKILLAVDGSAYTKKMLAYLATHAEMFGPNNAFSLITVQLPLPPRARAAVGAEEANSYYAEEAEKVTAPVVKFLKRHGIDPKIIHKVGSPGELVMMGSHGHSALGNLVMGSVATQVLAHCGVPVMMVR